MNLDFNMKLDFELGFHGGKYYIDRYVTGVGGEQGTNKSMSYYNYAFLLGIRLKYDFQITDSVSVEPYVFAGITPVYMYAPSDYLSNALDIDLGFTSNPSYVFRQSDIWGLDYFGVGVDIDFTAAAVEYSGSAKYKLGIAYRKFDRDVKYLGEIEGTKVNLLCITGTVLF
jgi:hypothetical protein